MTNTELLSKIKDFVNEQKELLSGFELQSDFRRGETAAYSVVLSFLSTLESEKPMNLGERIGSYNIVPYIDDKIAALQDMWREEKVAFDWDDMHEMIEDVARHFYDLGCRRTAEKYDEIEYNRQRAEESVPNDLEEYASRAGFDYVDNIVQEHPGHRFNDHDVEYAYRDGIIAGYKYHADHTPLPEDTVLFNKGVAEGRRLAEEEQAGMFTIVALDAAQRAKEQMMKDAVKWLVDDDYHELTEKGKFILGSVGLGYNGYYIPYSDLLKLPKEDEK